MPRTPEPAAGAAQLEASPNKSPLRRIDTALSDAAAAAVTAKPKGEAPAATAGAATAEGRLKVETARRQAAEREVADLRDRLAEEKARHEAWKTCASEERDWLVEQLADATRELALRPQSPPAAAKEVAALKAKLRTARAEAQHYKSNLEEAVSNAAAWMEEVAELKAQVEERGSTIALLTTSLLGLDYADE